MKYHVISYDLDYEKSSESYKKLHDAINAISKGIWVKPLESFYIVKTNYTSLQLTNLLKAILDDGDSLFVVEINLHDATSYGLDKDMITALDSLTHS